MALDTNVLLRLLLDDDPKQSRQVRDAVDRAVRQDQPLLLPDIVLCETEWVLASVYKLPRTRIIEVLRRLLEGTEFTFVDRGAVATAVDNYAHGKAEFSDYLIGAVASAAGAATTYTFDRDLRTSNDFTLLQG